MSIRQADIRDTATCMMIDQECFPNEAFSRSTWRRWLHWGPIGAIRDIPVQGDQCGAFYRVYIREDGVVPTACMVLKMPKSGGIRIESLAVRPAYRNGGRAREMKALAEEVAFELNRLVIRSVVRVSNKAMIALNISLGYFIDRHEVGYYDDGEDGYLMKLKLNKPRRDQHIELRAG